jgi:hypothetical protein
LFIDLDRCEAQSDIDLETSLFKAYHCTRAFKFSIERNGLLVLDFQRQIRDVSAALRDYGIDEAKLDAYVKSVRKYINPSQLKGREGRTWFLLNESLTRQRGCQNFFRYFGGEAFFRVAQSNADFNNIREALSRVGEPLLITARISLTSAPLFMQRQVLDSMKTAEKTSAIEVCITSNTPMQQVISIQKWNAAL